MCVRHVYVGTNWYNKKVKVCGNRETVRQRRGDREIEREKWRERERNGGEERERERERESECTIKVKKKQLTTHTLNCFWPVKRSGETQEPLCYHASLQSNGITHTHKRAYTQARICHSHTHTHICSGIPFSAWLKKKTIIIMYFVGMITCEAFRSNKGRSPRPSGQVRLSLLDLLRYTKICNLIGQMHVHVSYTYMNLLHTVMHNITCIHLSKKKKRKKIVFQEHFGAYLVHVKLPSCVPHAYNI